MEDRDLVGVHGNVARLGRGGVRGGERPAVQRPGHGGHAGAGAGRGAAPARARRRGRAGDEGYREEGGAGAHAHAHAPILIRCEVGVYLALRHRPGGLAIGVPQGHARRRVPAPRTGEGRATHGKQKNERPAMGGAPTTAAAPQLPAGVARRLAPPVWPCLAPHPACRTACRSPAVPAAARSAAARTVGCSGSGIVVGVEAQGEEASG